MTLAFASGSLYAALHQPIYVVVVSVLLETLWLVAVVVVCAFILLNLLWARDRLDQPQWC